MIIKTIQWNIGGGKVRKTDDDPEDFLAFRNDALDSIIATLKIYNPDIVTIQECHTDNNRKQAEVIAKGLGLEYFVNDIYDKSHLEEGQGLSQAIISRFPIQNKKFSFFTNPKFEIIGPDGKQWVSHDKGVTSCVLNITDDTSLNIKASHAIPFGRFQVDPFADEALDLRRDMTEKLQPDADLFLYQGDLNFNDYSIKKFLPDLFRDGLEEVVLSEPTTPKGRKYDHILFKNLKHVKSSVNSSVLTDHFPIYSEFEMNV